MRNLRWNIWDGAVELTATDKQGLMELAAASARKDPSPDMKMGCLLSGDTLVLVKMWPNGDVEVWDCAIRRVGRSFGSCPDGDPNNA